MELATQGPTLAEEIACVGREIALREAVYPRQVASGRMKRSTADRELAAMRAVLKRLEALRDHMDAAAAL